MQAQIVEMKLSAKKYIIEKKWVILLKDFSSFKKDFSDGMWL